MTKDRQTRPALRRLLARVRDVMASAGPTAATLDRLVEVIAANMVAEVCSVYVRRAGDVLELFATEGLNVAAVHRTRLRVGEGLIGDIAAHARPLALADAQHHPAFVFRPETGEEIYHSLMGVPILRGGRVLGVLAVQNRTQRQYTEEEIETLQTVAMVVAEFVAGGEIISRSELIPADGIALRPLRLEGVGLSPGRVLGAAVLHEPTFRIRQMVADDPAAEERRLHQAVSEMHGALDVMLGSAELAQGGEHRAILETYRMIAEDSGWLGRIAEAVRGGLTAEAAVQKVRNDIRARMGQISDPYLRERLHDLEDLNNRLLEHLTGERPAAANMVTDAILVARTMGPAQLLDFDRTHIKGMVLEEGTPTAHVVIVARALGIPVVGQVHDAVARVESGDPVIIDGDSGIVFVRPGEEVAEEFLETVAAAARDRPVEAGLGDLPAESRDGLVVDLHLRGGARGLVHEEANRLNVGLLADLAFLEPTGAEGVGLFRTEIPFMVRAEFPSVEAQRALYGEAIRQAGGRPLVFRTFDVGGDKTAGFWRAWGEANPAMGWRAIRVSLDRPAMLRHQLRALIEATAGAELHVMFPMITVVSEFDAARALLDRELERAARRGQTMPGAVRVGTMLEVPALVYQLDQLARRVDFVSIGSNDLLQFLFASDRGNPRLAQRYDPLSPPALALMADIRSRCAEAGVPVCLCGEVAARPLEAMAMLGLGYSDLSVPPGSIGPVRTMVRSLEIGALGEYMLALKTLSRQSVREMLREFAVDHGVKI